MNIFAHCPHLNTNRPRCPERIPTAFPRMGSLSCRLRTPWSTATPERGTGFRYPAWRSERGRWNEGDTRFAPRDWNGCAEEWDSPYDTDTGWNGPDLQTPSRSFRASLGGDPRLPYPPAVSWQHLRRGAFSVPHGLRDEIHLGQGSCAGGCRRRRPGRFAAGSFRHCTPADADPGRFVDNTAERSARSWSWSRACDGNPGFPAGDFANGSGGVDVFASENRTRRRPTGEKAYRNRGSHSTSSISLPPLDQRCESLPNSPRTSHASSTPNINPPSNPTPSPSIPTSPAPTPSLSTQITLLNRLRRRLRRAWRDLRRERECVRERLALRAWSEDSASCIYHDRD